MTHAALPIFFGAHDRRLFGWLHRPTQLETAGIGLVICAPFGYEAICSHRTMRHFATMAAEQGLPALRFDYDGTGDSAGSDLDPDRVGAWVSSIELAIDELKNRSGVRSVCVLGIRLGALLAAAALQKRDDVTGFIAIAPVTSARSYLRELRALSLSRPQPEAPPGTTSAEDLLESAGFRLTSETRASLMPLELAKQERWPRDVLVIDRDDMPGRADWVDTAKRAGGTVTYRQLPGYTEMMLDSHEAIVPSAMLDAAAQWLQQLATTLPKVESRVPEIAAPPAVHFAAEGKDEPIVESAEFLDTHRRVFGIVAASETTRASSRPAPTILLLNSGAVHHIGPNRLYVRLARRWAAQGAICVRLDLSGLGDSNTRPGQAENIVYSRFAHEDILQVIATLRERYPCGDVHALGLCSGAYHSFKSAVAGIDFRSVVAINPLTFAWREGTSLAYPQYRVAQDVMRYRTNAFQWASWKKLLTGGVDLRELGIVLLKRAGTLMNSSARNIARALGLSLRNDLGTELQNLGKRQIELLFVFAKGEPGIDLLNVNGGSVVERLSRRGQLKVHMIDGADHTFTASWSRDRLADELSSHVDRWLADASR